MRELIAYATGICGVMFFIVMLIDFLADYDRTDNDWD